MKYGEFAKQIRLLLKDRTAAMVTTMIDYQGLGMDFPGRDEAKKLDASVRANHVEDAMREDIGEERYRPFVFLHEFEALLYAGPNDIADVLKLSRLAQLVTSVVKDYGGSPAAINDSPATSPSARIEAFCKEIGGSEKLYQKRTLGVVIAERIGLGAMRGACPHFDAWVSTLEELGGA